MSIIYLPLVGKKKRSSTNIQKKMLKMPFSRPNDRIPSLKILVKNIKIVYISEIITINTYLINKYYIKNLKLKR